MKQSIWSWRLRMLFLGGTIMLLSCLTEMKRDMQFESISAPFNALEQSTLLPPHTIPPIPAFPGAEGFGANTVGGRGGQVVEVTNLNDSGPGSLRAAIDAEGPRIVVFRTGGTIELQSSLLIDTPYITIAGQTAPGGGIMLRNHPSNGQSALKVQTHDVVIRYIRIRPGASVELSSSLDALQITNSYNVIIDHSSFSWATDEVMSVWHGSHDITLQWNIIAEALNNSTHQKGPHSKGLMLGSDGGQRISVHHNLLAHNEERNPRIKTSGIVDVVNNVIYNPEFIEGSWGPSHSTNDFAEVAVNYVGNYFKPGPDTGPDSYYVSTSGPGAIFLEGNFVPHDVIRPDDQKWVVETRLAAPMVTTTTAQDAYEQVLDQAGAICPVRDAVDLRVVNDVLGGTSSITDDPSEVGGWPELEFGRSLPDRDHDGMPDTWEQANGLNPRDPSDGRANLETYLNECAWAIHSFIFLPAIFLPVD